MSELKPEDVELSPALQAQEEAETKGKAKPEPVAEDAPAEVPAEEPEVVEAPEADDAAEPEKTEDDKPKKRGKSAEQRIDELMNEDADLSKTVQSLFRRLNS